MSSRGVEVVWNVPESVCRVEADPETLQRVFVNLIVNARDALEENRPEAPRITVDLEEDDDFVTYVVEDNGPGVPPPLVPRLFEPFFTTKEPGKGTGLGLSLSLGIVREHRGDLFYERSDRGMSRFVVKIPRHTEGE